ncbi:hypothetical protein G7Y79_00014g037630 [Physcia stellaris]|nr:hypothetical protein G7Y79_00014g037630 [Physcia stellaris]
MYATVALLGVMKAGAAFVQLDVTLPEARLKDIISQLDAPLLLSSKSKLDLAERLEGPRIAVVSEGAQTLQVLPDFDIRCWVTDPSDRLCIIFTSGSTGKPAGAIISHANFTSASIAASSYLGFDSGTRMFDFCSYAWDMSIYCVLSTLMAGGCVCVPSEADRIERPEATLTAMAATTMHATPALARVLDPLRTPTLEMLMVGGESIGLAVLKKWTEYIPVIHTYGPTECTCTATAMRYEKGSRPDRVSIGRGLGCATWVIDSDMHELVPIGVVGELVIQGPIVGCGYLNNSTKKAEAFIPDLTWVSTEHDSRDGVQSRGYMTGDLVRYDENGCIHFLGRKDTQRKIRGQRFELGEVENHTHAILARLGGGIEVVAEVCAAADAPDTNLLVVFVKMPGRGLEIEQESSASNGPLIMSPDNEIRDIGMKLKSSISKVLPAYMVPSVVVKLSRMPWLLPSLKIDRKALRSTIGEMSRAQLSEFETVRTTVKIMPATDTQRLLQNLWATALGMQAANIGLNDHFFRLGGDSVSAMQLISTARTQGMHMKMADVLSSPILCDMALAVEVLQAEDSAENHVAPFSLLGKLDINATIHEAARCCNVGEAQIEDIFPCTPLQEGMMAISMRKIGSQVACAVFELPKNIDFPRLRAAWIATVRAHSILRTRIVQLGQVGMVQVVLKEDPTLETALKVEDFLSGHSEGCDGSKYIVIKLHHAVTDGWQESILLEHITRAYHGEQIPKETGFNNFWGTTCDIPSETFGDVYTLGFWVKEASYYMQSDDFVFGTTLTGRNAPVSGIESVIGPTIATVPLRFRLNYEESVHYALGRVHEQAIAMVPYEQTGLQHIRRLSPEIANTCDFQTLLVVQPPVVRNDVEMLKECAEEPYTGFAFGSFGLVLECKISNDRQQIIINAEIDDNVLESEQVDNMLRQFDHVLNQIYNYPNRRLAEIEVISPQDIVKIRSWNATMPTLVNRTLHELFKERCDANPTAPAVSTSLEELSYAELDDLSSRLANHLQKLGIRREMVVPLFVGNSYLSAVAILGVLKSGGTCACLDLSQPKQRLDHIIHEVDAKIALIAGSQIDSRWEAGIEFIPLTRSWLEDLPVSVDSEWARDSTSAAFLVYTSGSTKAPKGIVIEHQALASGFLSVIAFCGLGTSCRVLQFASSVFDIFIHEHLMTLIAGGCICIPSKDEKMNGVAEFASKTQCNFALMTSTGLKSIDMIPSMRMLFVGGEPMDPDVVKLWGSSAKLVNAYGPAECCICASNFIDTSSRRPMDTIGYSLGSLFWIVKVDDPTRLAPIGVIGELLVEGPVLARGYFHDPVQTAAAFIEAPQWVKEIRPDAKCRFFRTGDLVKYNPDGSFVYVGRKDTQVKLRGCRVELGEVEYQLSKQFDQAAVAAEVVHIKAGDDARLIAFVSTDPGLDIGSEGLILPPEYRLKRAPVVLQELANILPTYMIPSALLPVRYLPKSASDKTDRKLLRQAAGELTIQDLMAYSGQDLMEPQTPKTSEEHLMSNLWAEVLRVSLHTIGSNSNFFHLGGDSVVAMRLVSAARSKHRLLTVQMIFKLPVLSDLTQEWTPLTENEEHEQAWSPFSLLNVSNTSAFLTEHICKPFQINIDDIVDVLPATQHQTWEIQGSSPVMVFEFENGVDLDRLLKSWDQVVEKHEILRTVLIPHDGGDLQVVLRKPAYGLEIHSTEEMCQALIEENTKADLPAPGTSPLHILVVKTKEHTTWTLRISHAIYDGWSISEIWKDWETAFAGSMITERGQFRKYFYATANAGRNGSYDYWRNLLAGSVPTCFRATCSNGSLCPEERTVETTRVIALDSLPEICTMATFIKASWALTLAKRIATMDIIMLQVTSGRRPGQGSHEDVIGPCLAFFPVRVTVQPHWRPLDLFQFIHNQDVESMPFENIQLKDLVLNCTDWPPTMDQNLGTIWNHGSDEWVTSVKMQGREHPVTCHFAGWELEELYLNTSLAGNKLEVEIQAPTKIMGQRELEEVAGDFCAAVSHLSNGQDGLCSDFINGCASAVWRPEEPVSSYVSVEA